MEELIREGPRAWQGDAQEVHLLYPSRRYQPLRARLFMDFIQQRLATLPGFTA